ncbi:MAG: hypothetical protein M3292_03280 [Actinomycetota bacterium]|nr:hypothetical protein [Actinomycetota bacterium]
MVNEPRVEELTYEFVVVSKGHFFPNAQAWEGAPGEFACRLEAGKLTARPSRDFGAPADARAVLEPFLRAWKRMLSFRAQCGSSSGTSQQG